MERFKSASDFGSSLEIQLRKLFHSEGPPFFFPARSVMEIQRWSEAKEGGGGRAAVCLKKREARLMRPEGTEKSEAEKKRGERRERDGKREKR